MPEASLTAADRLTRILYLLPAASQEGGASIQELATQLNVKVDALLTDLHEANGDRLCVSVRCSPERRYRTHKVLAQTEAGAFAELDAVGGGCWHKCVHRKVKTDSGGVTSRLGFRPDKNGRWVEVIDRLFGSVFGAAAADPYEAEISRAVEWVAVARVMGLAGGAAMPQLRAISLKRLEDQREALEGMTASADDSDAAHYSLLSGTIERFLSGQDVRTGKIQLKLTVPRPPLRPTLNRVSLPPPPGNPNRPPFSAIQYPEADARVLRTPTQDAEHWIGSSWRPDRRCCHEKGETKMVSGTFTELRYALRGLRRSPGFTLVAVLSLALGIGANMAIFGVVKTLLLTPLPVENPEELSLVTWRSEGDFDISQYGSTSYTDPATGIRYRSNLSYPIYRALLGASPPGTQLFAFSFLRGVSVAVGDQPAFLAGGALADGAYFAALGVGMALGRPLTPADDVPEAPLVAVLSHSFWMRAFGGDPEILGKTVRVNGNPAEVIGVTAAGFKGLSMGGFFPQTEITVPLISQPRVYARMASGRTLFTTGETFWLRVMARIRDGASEASVEQSLDRVLKGHPSPLLADDGHLPLLRLLPGDRGAQPIRATSARLLYFLMGVVGVVLLIACVNLAGLTLARGAARQREIAVRRALGVGRFRLVRQLLMEGFVLSVAGTGLGLFLVVIGRGFLRDLLTGSVGSGAFGDTEIFLAMDPVVISMGVGLAVVATIGSGLIPALRLSGQDPSTWLKPRGAGGDSPRLTVGRVLIALQISVSVPLVVAAALFLRTMDNLGAVELGFDPRGLAVFQVDPGFTELEAQEYGNLYLELLARLEGIPGVASVTVMENALMGGIISNTRVNLGGEEFPLHRNAVGPAFLETLGIELLLKG